MIRRRRQGFEWGFISRAVATVQQDRAGRLAVATVRLGLAVMSSGISLLPWPTSARMDALFVAAGGSLSPVTWPEPAAAGIDVTAAAGHPLPIGAVR